MNFKQLEHPMDDLGVRSYIYQAETPQSQAWFTYCIYAMYIYKHDCICKCCPLHKAKILRQTKITQPSLLVSVGLYYRGYL